jgi:molybdopterin-guanine dinucleotide biosynthesis protein A
MLSIASQLNKHSPVHLKTGIDEYCLVVPCDMPFLPVDLVERLHDALASHAAGYACTIHQVQPLVLLMRPHLLKTIPEYLQQGGRSVMGWLRSIDAIPVSFTPERGLADTGRVESKTGYDEAMDVPVGDNKLSMADGLRRNDFDNINDLASLSFLEKAF